ncbi:hypothetical protein [Streptomyces sp. NPDC056361]|uniref:hypothetical protein n=1 Tax=Streptomyces sp. NPDC056361 TaxID=3345795 RepID=UPI0035E30BAD
MGPDMDRVDYRVDLAKTSGTYYVIADDHGVYSGKEWLENWEGERDVLDVQRAADCDIERELQRTDFTRSALASQSPLQFLTVEATSHGRAAFLAKRAYREAQAFQNLQDVFFADELAFDPSHFGDTTS